MQAYALIGTFMLQGTHYFRQDRPRYGMRGKSGGGLGYMRVHQASMITSWAMPVSMV